MLVSIVTGLAATRLMSALSEMIQVANRPRVYWIHVVWILTLFIELMLYWWVLYRWHSAAAWNFFLFVWVTIPGILVYLASAVLFPGELETTGSPDWRDYYYKNRRGFSSSSARSRRSTPSTRCSRASSISSTRDAAGLTRNEKYHAAWAILFPLVLICYTALVLLPLG